MAAFEPRLDGYDALISLSCPYYHGRYTPLYSTINATSTRKYRFLNGGLYLLFNHPLKCTKRRVSQLIKQTDSIPPSSPKTLKMS